MKHSEHFLTRRDFIKSTGSTAVGVAIGLPLIAGEITKQPTKARVVLVRHKEVVTADGKINGEIIGRMLDQAVSALLDVSEPAAGWKKIVHPEDVVGIKSNEWGHLSTPTVLEQALKDRIIAAGVNKNNVSIDDHGVLNNPVFAKATALINTRPLRTHAWSGVGSLIKNYIMFSPDPPKYHPDSCASLGALWELPAVKGKTRLNVLVMLTPLFHGSGWHHFDPTYVWPYGGILVGTDPVAVDTIGLSILGAKRRAFFDSDRPLSPPAHHIVLADRKYHLGTSDPSRIELIKLGWKDGILI
ncbi:MAG: DUF362 domain-containing protein [bacterium]